MRKEKVDHRRCVGEEGFVAGHRRDGGVYGAEHPGKRGPVLGSAQQAERAVDGGEAGAPVGVATVPVVVRGAAVQADAYRDPLLSEPREHVRVEQHPVGLDPHLQRADAVERGAKVLYQCGQPVGTGEQGFATVQDEPHRGQPVGLGVLGHPAGGRPPRLGSHERGAVSPGLVRHRVDVAVIARQVAPLMDFQHQIAERCRAPPASPQRRHVQ
jgi:hypothetical protein